MTSRCLLFLAMVEICIFMAQGAKLPCPEFQCPLKGMVRSRFPSGTDERGCPTYFCKSRCSDYGMACLPGMVVGVVGKDEMGCPIKECVPKSGCPNFQCPKGLEWVVTGLDKGGCPTFNCVSK